jgi:hypothetical protein
MLRCENRSRFCFVGERKFCKGSRKPKRHFEMALHRLLPGRLDWKIKEARRGIDELGELIGVRSHHCSLHLLLEARARNGSEEIAGILRLRSK